jgi:transcriptional regulator with XRE-family HTH domain
MTDQAIEARPTPPHLGRAIRARRRALDLTLKTLGERSGLSVGFLSQLERDLATPSLSALSGIAAALGVPLDSFLAAPRPTSGLTRRGERPQFSVGGIQGDSPDQIRPDQIRYERLSTAFPGQSLNSVLVHVPPGYESEVVRHEGEEIAYVLEGSMIVGIGGESIRLDAGDSLHYAAGRDHRWINAQDGWTRVLWTGTAPLFDRLKEDT